jgi:hypothetical protein
MDKDGGMILTGENRRTRRKPCPSATLSTTNSTWIDPDANPRLRGDRPATNHLSHGTAHSHEVLTELMEYTLQILTTAVPCIITFIISWCIRIQNNNVTPMAGLVLSCLLINKSECVYVCLSVCSRLTL